MSLSQSVSSFPSLALKLRRETTTNLHRQKVESRAINPREEKLSRKWMEGASSSLYFFLYSFRTIGCLWPNTMWSSCERMLCLGHSAWNEEEAEVVLRGMGWENGEEGGRERGRRKKRMSMHAFRKNQKPHCSIQSKNPPLVMGMQFDVRRHKQWGRLNIRENRPLFCMCLLSSSNFCLIVASDNVADSFLSSSSCLYSRAETAPSLYLSWKYRSPHSTLLLAQTNDGIERNSLFQPQTSSACDSASLPLFWFFRFSKKAWDGEETFLFSKSSNPLSCTTSQDRDGKRY